MVVLYSLLMETIGPQTDLITQSRLYTMELLEPPFAMF